MVAAFFCVQGDPPRPAVRGISPQRTDDENRIVSELRHRRYRVCSRTNSLQEDEVSSLHVSLAYFEIVGVADDVDVRLSGFVADRKI